MTNEQYDYIHNVLEQNVHMRKEQMLNMINVCGKNLEAVHSYIREYRDANDALEQFVSCAEDVIDE